jgi:hypothetical protein
MTKNNIDISKYNIKLSDDNKNKLFGFIIICLIALLFKDKFSIYIERVLLFIIIFSLLIAITKNWVISIITTLILFSLFNLLLNTRRRHSTLNIENFDNSDSDEKLKKELADKVKSTDSTKDQLESKKEELKKKISSSDFINDITSKMQDYTNNKDTQAAASGLQDLLKQLDGGIEFKEKDTKETDKLNVDTKEYKDDSKFDPMKKAQQDTYELINMVDSLKNTMETLAPVLTQGKEIMNMFENFKL